MTQYCHRWTDVPGHAAHCRLSSVPGLLHTTLETIPAKIPYLFADPVRVAAWRERLGAMPAPGDAPDRPGLDRPADPSQ